MTIDLILAAFSRLRRLREHGMLLLATLVGALLVSAISSLGSAWQVNYKQQARRTGFDRISLTSATDEPLTHVTIDEIQRLLPTARIVPQLTAMVWVEGADGEMHPLLASSRVANDPLLSGTALLSGELDNHNHSDWSIVLCPATLQRLGYEPNQPPTQMRVETRRYVAPTAAERNPDDQSAATLAKHCDVAAIVGDLGRIGIRLPLPSLIEARMFQLGVDGSAPSAFEREDQVRLAPGPVAASETVSVNREACELDQPLADQLARVDEIHTLHVSVGDDDVAKAVTKLQSTGSFRIEAPYLERGKERAFYQAIAALASPLAVCLLGLAGWAIATVVAQAIDRKTGEIRLLTLAGASPLTIQVFYGVPFFSVSLTGACLGAIVAWSALHGPGQVVNDTLGISVVAEFSPQLVAISTISFTLLTTYITLYRASNTG